MACAPSRPRLLLAAHGTESEEGRAVTAAFVDALRAALPHTHVSGCYLDSLRGTLAPTLAQALDAAAGRPAVVVPLLLSAGYHVQSDIPAVVAGRRQVRVTPHLGPEAAVVDALTDRLGEVTGAPPAAIALVGVGSTRSRARSELETAGAMLSERVRVPVSCATVFDDLTALLAGLPAPAVVCSYLLAPGTFADRIRAAARPADPLARTAGVSAPIGAHPAVVSLVAQRYRAACADLNAEPIR